MAPVTDAQRESIRTRIQALTRPSIAVRDVQIEDTEEADGTVVLVTVILDSLGPETEAGWDSNDFLEIRRAARTAAVEALSGQDVRLVYGADRSTDVTQDQPHQAGDKQAQVG